MKLEVYMALLYISTEQWYMPRFREMILMCWLIRHVLNDFALIVVALVYVNLIDNYTTLCTVDFLHSIPL